MHEIEVHTCCDGCESDVVMKDPLFDIEILTDKTARLMISNESLESKEEAVKATTKSVGDGENDVSWYEEHSQKKFKQYSPNIMEVSRIVEKAIVNQQVGVLNGTGFAFDTRTRDLGFIKGNSFNKAALEKIVKNHTHNTPFSTKIKVSDDGFVVYLKEPD
jgi:hypothetical protein